MSDEPSSEHLLHERRDPTTGALLSRAVTLYTRDDPRLTVASVTATINQRGALVVHGCDTGTAPQQWFGSSEYEYWLTVHAHDLPDLRHALALDDPTDTALLRRLHDEHAGSPQAFEHIRAFLHHHHVPFSFDTWT